MTAYAQIYCTVAELVADLRLIGDEPGLLDRVKSASRHMLNLMGNFIPIKESRTFYPSASGELEVGPLLEIISVTNGTDVVTDYVKVPTNRHWANGPYTWLQRDSWSDDGVTVEGRWGKYEESLDLGLSVSQLVGDLTLVVTNGSLVSPGMVLLIGTEQELVTAGNGGDGSPDGTLATSQLNGAITATDEEVTVDNGAEFHAREVFRVGTEDFYIQKIAGHVLVCRRGWNGTTKASHATDAPIYVYRTFAVLRAVNGTTAAAHTTAAVSRMVVPEDVNWLCRQVAGLMRAKAAAAFANKSGNSELGETYYFNEFPNQLQKIRESYWLP